MFGCATSHGGRGGSGGGPPAPTRTESRHRRPTPPPRGRRRPHRRACACACACAHRAGVADVRPAGGGASPARTVGTCAREERPAPGVPRAAAANGVPGERLPPGAASERSLAVPGVHCALSGDVLAVPRAASSFRGAPELKVDADLNCRARPGQVGERRRHGFHGNALSNPAARSFLGFEVQRQPAAQRKSHRVRFLRPLESPWNGREVSAFSRSVVNMRRRIKASERT